MISFYSNDIYEPLYRLIRLFMKWSHFIDINRQYRKETWCRFMFPSQFCQYCANATRCFVCFTSITILRFCQVHYIVCCIPLSIRIGCKIVLVFSFTLCKHHGNGKNDLNCKLLFQRRLAEAINVITIQNIFNFARCKNENSLLKRLITDVCFGFTRYKIRDVGNRTNTSSLSKTSLKE